MRDHYVIRKAKVPLATLHARPRETQPGSVAHASPKTRAKIVSTFLKW